VSSPEMSLINHFKWKVPTNEQLEPSQECHPKWVWSRGVTNHVSSGEFHQTNNLNPFKSVIRSVSGPEMSLINHFKWQVLNNGQLESTFCLCIKWLVLNNGPLEFTFNSVSSG